jgi:hypothetical protein
MKHWTQEEIEIIKEKASQGISYKDIGEIIGRSAKAICLKMQKLGFVFEDLYKKPLLYCENCNSTLKTGQYKYCCKSCAAKVNNTKFPKRLKEFKICENKITKVYKEREIKKCINCGKDSKNKKYCSNLCSSDFRNKERKEEVIQDDNTLHPRAYKKFLIDKFGNQCMECGWNKINPKTGKCPIELEHIDGNHTNNYLNNLKLLCPNCHSLTPTYKFLNNGNGRAWRSKRYKDGKSY